LQELASEHSTCPSGKNGGSLGEFSPGQMVKEFNDVVFTTGKVGQVEGPVKTQFGYHLILITRRGDEKM
jgi:peptidyl-prolyl cis-trans isomerase C